VSEDQGSGGLDNYNSAARFRVVLKDADGTRHVLVVPPTAAVLTSMSLEDPNGYAIVVVPFHFHDGTESLHTICRDGSNEVRQVEW
jgi:hypothetical protein